MLLPLLGSRGSLIASAALALVSSVALAVSLRKTAPNFAGFSAIVGPVALVMCALNSADPFAVAMAEHRRERFRPRHAVVAHARNEEAHLDLDVVDAVSGCVAHPAVQMLGS